MGTVLTFIWWAPRPASSRQKDRGDSRARLAYSAVRVGARLPDGRPVGGAARGQYSFLARGEWRQTRPHASLGRQVRRRAGIHAGVRMELWAGCVRLFRNEYAS